MAAPAAQSAGSPPRVLDVGPQPSTGRAATAAEAKAPRKKVPITKGKPVSTDGREPRSLDEYLARLERDGFVGKSWYREVRPGVYELVTNMKPAPEKRLFTRTELARQFGFAE